MNQETLPPPPSDKHCLLTLALPQSLEEEMLDLLHANEDLVPGFSVVHGHGLGAGVALVSAMERVQGRARRVLVQAVMREADLAPLLARLGSVLNAPSVFYWAVPLLASGRLG